MTRLLPIRGEDPPDDTVVIVRAGVMAAESIRRTAEDSFADYGAYLVSVEAVLKGTVEHACRTSPRIGQRYGHIRLSTVGRLRAAGFPLLATFASPHFDVVLPGTGEAVLAGLERCFDAPVPNPAKHDPPVS